MSLAVLNNSKWMLIEQAFNFLNSIFIIFILSNFLGADSFGMFSYVIGFVSIISFLAYFGIDGILIRELNQNNNNESEVLGSSFILIVLTSAISFFIVNFASFIYIKEAIIIKLIFIYSFTLIAAPLKIFYLFYNARLDLITVSKVRILILSIFIILKIAAYINNLDITIFIILETLSLFAVLASACYIFFFSKNMIALKFSLKAFIDLFRKCLPLMISSGAIIIYAKIDLIIIEYFLDFAQVGLYAFSIKVAEIWYVIPVTLTSILFPLILKSKKKSPGEYKEMLEISSEVILVICFMLSIFIFIFAPLAIDLYMKPEYTSTKDIIRIIALCGPFVGLGYINGRYMVSEGLLYLTMRRNLYGIFINIILNIILIPRFGLYGAALSTLFAMAYVGFICLPFSKRTQNIFKIQSRAFLILINPLKLLKNLSTLKNL